jgi:C4-dicarboxylate-specific signal transduction histidine kinase
VNDREIAFIESAIAGASHELLNTLAIIGQASGLLEDILKLNRRELSSWAEKALEGIARVRRQVARGAELSEHLNSFAHGLRDSPEGVALNRVLTRIAFLLQHNAKIRNIELRTNLSEASPEIRIDPFRVQVVIALFIHRCLELANPGGTITLQTEERDQLIAIRCKATPARTPAVDDSEARARSAGLEEAADASGMRLVFGGPMISPDLELELQIPRR